MSSSALLKSSSPSTGALPSARRTSMALKVELSVATCSPKLGSPMNPPDDWPPERPEPASVLLPVCVDRHVEVPSQIRLTTYQRAPADLLPLASALRSDLHPFRGDGHGVQLAIQVQLSLDRLIEFGSHDSSAVWRSAVAHKSLCTSGSLFQPRQVYAIDGTAVELRRGAHPLALEYPHRAVGDAQ